MHKCACRSARAPVDAVEVAEDLAVLLDRLELQGVLTRYSRAYRPTPGTNRKGVLTHLQAGLQDFDEAADPVGDLGARRAELVRADDLRTSASAAARFTHPLLRPVTRRHVHGKAPTRTP